MCLAPDTFTPSQRSAAAKAWRRLFEHWVSPSCRISWRRPSGEGLSFWTAGEIEDKNLRQEAVAAAASVLFGFVAADRKDWLAEVMTATAI